MVYKLNAITGKFDLVGTGEGIQALTSAERLALTPTEGLVVYDKDLQLLFYYNGNSWVET